MRCTVDILNEMIAKCLTYWGIFAFCIKLINQNLQILYTVCKSQTTQVSSEIFDRSSNQNFALFLIHEVEKNQRLHAVLCQSYCIPSRFS